MMRWRRLFAIARKETLQLSRDSRSLLMAFGLPLALLVLFGYAITWDIRNIRTAVVDHDLSAESRELLDAFRASGYFSLDAVLDSEKPIEGLLDQGAIDLVLVVPPDYGERLNVGDPVPIQAIVDGSDANTATIVLGYTRGVVGELAIGLAAQGREIHPPLVTRTRVWYNEELTSRNMIVPGLVAVIMMIIAAMLTSLTLSREWERGTMEQLAATPVTRTEVVLGKLLPYVVIGLIDVGATTVLGILLFGVPFRGDALLFGVLALFFLLGALGLGIFISAVARSQLLATQMAMLASFLPSFLLSGFMFAIEVMPRPLRLLTYLIPARYFLVVTRGIFLKGVGIEVLRVQGLLMVAFAVVGIGAAVWRFRKELA